MTESLKILVVDDDVDNACSLGELLEMEGHDVKIVHTGEDAIRAAQQQEFNISFMDVVLPGMNGVESFIQIRRVRPTARVYMMTGYSVEQLLTQALNGGALGVLEKPFDPEAIIKLTTSVGLSGLVVASPQRFASGENIGHFINSTLSEYGMRCRHILRPDDLNVQVSHDEILLLDLPAPLIEGMELYKRARDSGHRAQTVLVPHSRTPSLATDSPLTDITLTGILNKPFDPMELINKLSHLAA